MTDRIALTSNESSTPTLFIDTRAPLDELHASAAYRILAVTQLMESIVHMDNRQADATDLSQIAHASVILLRDGCDLLDVLGRRIRGSQHLS
ncbi:short-chain dehydrogenase [Pseudomonas sp. TH05]|uniref:short-chain dehydrogenase n=1 Tax=unclassified Pseudomonas TaxID=196821 RepID=UPI0019144ED6|nr:MULTISPECIES: short-chain dehydrogenase [unclassified Pseudomonas]MBK5539174.1 short-chain dehydrogenase [Pseudomonas sp. TH07]MBK5558392.1 short-chain dehydrogenase [Pseudomonas sp. TH05]